jgi:hypothetical protein
MIDKVVINMIFVVIAIIIIGLLSSYFFMIAWFAFSASILGWGDATKDWGRYAITLCAHIGLFTPCYMFGIYVIYKNAANIIYYFYMALLFFSAVSLSYLFNFPPYYKFTGQPKIMVLTILSR